MAHRRPQVTHQPRRHLGQTALQWYQQNGPYGPYVAGHEREIPCIALHVCRYHWQSPSRYPCLKMCSSALSVTSGLSQENSDGAEGGEWTFLPSPAVWVTAPSPALCFLCDIPMYHVHKPNSLLHSHHLYSLFPGLPTASPYSHITPIHVSI